MPSVPSISFNVRYDLTSAPTLVLTDATTYPVGAIGIFTITQPDGYVRTGNFSSPDVSSSGGTLSTALRLSSTGGVQCGTYIIKYEIRTTDLVISTFTREFIFTYVPVSLNLKENFDVFTPSLSYSDMTLYGVNNYSNTAPTRAWTAVSTPTGTKTGNTSTISLQHNGRFYDAVYTITLASTLTYQHTTFTWLSVLETVSKTVVAEACTPEPLEDIVAMMETLRQNSINCAGDLPIFEKAQSLFSHLMDQVKMALLNNIPQDGIYDTYEDLMAILRNGQPCVHTNLPIDPYDLGDYAVSPYPLDLSYCDLIGDGYNTTYTVNHNLNDDCVIVQVYESATGAQVLCDITVSDNNNVVASFYTAPTTDQYKVVVYAGARGVRGDVGPGVAAGGGIGQFLVKGSLADYETQWITPSFVPNARALTINGLTQDLSADRTWTIPSSNIYNSDGTLTGDRTVTMGAFTLSFEKDLTINGVKAGRGGGDVALNTCFGNNSLSINTGTRNTAFGAYTLQNNTTGVTNTAIGTYALQYNTTGVNNCAIGAFALQNNTTGIRNSALGNATLLSNTSGTFNTAIGLQAGYGSGVNANTTGSNNIFIGYLCVGTSSTDSNRTWIGNSSTTSTWLGGNLLLGTTTDTGLYKLDVTGAARVTGLSYFDSLLTANANITSLSSSIYGTPFISIKSVDVANPSYDREWQIKKYAHSALSTSQGLAIVDVTSASERMVLFAGTSQGVGINTNVNNGHGLEVNGTVKSGNIFATNLTLNGGTITDLSLPSFRFRDYAGQVRLDALIPSYSMMGLIDPTAKSIVLSTADLAGSSAVASAMFELRSTTKGFLAPRMTTTQRDAISSPATGLQVYNTTTNTNDYYNGTSWVSGGGAAGSNTQIQYNNSGAFGASANFTWDNTNNKLNLSASTSGSQPTLDIRQTLNTASTWLTVRNSSDYGTAGTVAADLGIVGASNQFFTGTTQGDIAFKAYSQANTSKFFLGATSGNTANLTLFTTGNIGVYTTTDAGYRLDVNGTARVKGTLNITLNSGISFDNGADPFYTNPITWSNFNGVTVQGVINVNTWRVNNSTINFYNSLTGNSDLGIGTSYTRARGQIQVGNSDNSVTLGYFTGSVLELGTTFSNSGSYQIRTVNPTTYPSAQNDLYIYGGVGSGNVAGDLFLQHNTTSKSGNVIIGTNIRTASAIVSIASTTQGFLPPRMTSTQKSAISTPATGLVIYQTDSTEGLYQYKSTGWEAIGGGGANIYTADGTLTSARTLTYTGNDLTFFTVRPSVGNRYITFHNSGRVTFNGQTENTSYEVNVNGQLLAGAGSMIGGTSGVNFDSGNLRLIFQDWSSVSFVRGGGVSVLYSDGTTASLGNGSARLNISAGSFSTNGGGVGTGANVYSIGAGTNNITTASYTVSIGSENLYGVTTGSTNIAIGGRWSGSGASRGNSGNHSSSIFLGVGTGAATNTTALTNTTIIGHDILTDASNSVILGRSDQNVVIGGVVNAGYKLDVNGTARVSGQITGRTLSNSTGASDYSIELNGISTTDATTRILINCGTLSSTGAGFGARALQATVSDYGVGTFINANGNSSIGHVVTTASNSLAIRGFAVRTNGQGTDGSIAYTWFNGNNVDYFHSIHNDGTYHNLRLYNNTGCIYYVRDLGTTNITFGSYTHYASAQVAIDSTTKGFLPPRMTTTQRNAISSPAVGLVAYQTDGTEGLYQYKSTGWVLVGGSGGGSGTVTSVDMSVPTGFAISGNPVTTTGTLALAFASGYSLPTTTSQTNWDTAYTNRITSLTTTGSSGSATLVSNVLNVPTYTLAGLGGVPTSRTLTINGTGFDLSADRSWTVSAGAAGTTGQVQYNNAGSLGGASYVNINQGHIELIDAGTLPTPPATGRVILFSEDHAGKSLPSVLGPSGVDYNLQAALYGNTTYMWLASTGTTVAINWGTSFTSRNNGTSAAQSHPTKASTNAMTSMNRANFGTGTTATGASGIQTSSTVAWLGNAAGLGGFLFFARFGIETLASDVRAFVGLSANNNTMAADSSTWANTIGIGKDTADSTWQIISRSATTLTKTNTTITVTQNQILDVYIHSAPNSGTIRVHIKDGATGADLFVSGALTTNIPATNTFMYMQAHIQSVSGTTAKNLALNRMYLETDL